MHQQNNLILINFKYQIVSVKSELLNNEFVFRAGHIIYVVMPLILSVDALFRYMGCTCVVSRRLIK